MNQKFVLSCMIGFAISLLACDGDSGNNASDSSSSENLWDSSSSVQIAETSSSNMIFTSSSRVYVIPAIIHDSITDSRDGQVYVTVIIGTQTWMSENLNFVTDSSWCYENIPDNCESYGRLYQWASAMNIDTMYNSNMFYAVYDPYQGICPEGSHLPSSNDWQKLKNYADSLNGEEGLGMSLRSREGWGREYNGTDILGFSALAAGVRNDSGRFVMGGLGTSFWSSQSMFLTASDPAKNIQYTVYTAEHWQISYDDVRFFTPYTEKGPYYGLSVRCVKNLE